MSTHHVNERSTGDPDPIDGREDADVDDIVKEVDDDFVETVDDAVEDVRSESVVTNHFRV